MAEEMTEVEIEAQRAAQVEAAMKEAGVATEERVQVDYFGLDESFRVVLPDGMSWIDHVRLNEGARRKYMNAMNREVRLQKATGDAILKVQSGEERIILLEAAITGWNLMRKGSPVPFNKRNLQEFLEVADPKIIDVIERDVRSKNPWLLADVTIEDIDRQIAELEEMREKKISEEEGKAT
jgi:hypothetical protein